MSGRVLHAPRTVAAAWIVVALVLAAGGCGASTDGGDTTCNEWIELDLPVEEAFGDLAEGQSGLSDEQDSILEDALDAEGLSTDELNKATAALNIAKYCGADGTGSRPNLGQPISGALKQ